MVPPGGGPRVAYRRTTTFVGALEDQSGLSRWKLRLAALGLSQRPDLVLAAAAAGPDDKDQLDEIAEQAMECAQASAAARTGTSLHTLTERLDRGCKLGPVPDPYGADLEAYEAATAVIEWTAVEAFRLLDGWRVAGTADRIGRINGDLVVADIKTGSIDYPGKFAMQLACYARSLPYDVASDSRGPADIGLNLSHGLIIHLPAGQGRCELHLVDLEKGWEGCLLAKQVWDWRAVRGLLQPIGTTDAATTFTEAARTAPDIDALRDLWRDAKAHNAITENFTAACGKRRQELAATTSG